MPLGRAERREIADIVSIVGSFDDIERPSPALEAVVPRLQRLLRADYGVAYRAAPAEETGWRVDWFLSHSDDGRAPFLAPLRRFIAKTPGTFCWYDAAHPAPSDRNVIRIPSQEVPEKELLEAPMMQKVFAPLGMERYDQMRVLLCDGSTLMAWFGGVRRERFTVRETAALRALIPSVRTRLLLERRLSKVELMERGLVAALEMLPSAAFLMARSGELVHANAVGRSLLDHAEGALLPRLRAFARGTATDPLVTRAPVRARGIPEHVLLTLASPSGDRASRLARARERWAITARQLDVLALVVQGDANKAIAEKLRCAVITVEVHVSAILAKAGVDSRTELVAKFWTTL
jgi:DNA-binding CsgD family transcriptional regulator